MREFQLNAFKFAAIVAFGGFIFGLDAALISGTVRFITAEFALSDLQVGTVVSAPGFGVIFALMVTGRICDAWGRKIALLIIASLYLLSAVASVLAPNFEMLVVARFLGGLAFTSLSLASMYIGEIAPPEMRGKLVSVNQITTVVGLSAAYFANYLILMASNADAAWVTALGIDRFTWRWMLGVEVLPALVWLLMLLAIPESPRWLVLKGRLHDARGVLTRLLPEGQIEGQIREIQASAASTPVGSFRQQVAEVFKPRLRTAFWVGLVIAVAQPITGINAIMFYAPTVFEQVGIGTDAAFLQAVVVGVISVLFTALALLLIDRVGRRPLVLFGLAWGGASLFLCSWAFSHASYALSAASLQSLTAAGIDISGLQTLVGTVFADDVAFKQAMYQVLGEAVARANEGILIQEAINIDATLVLGGIMCFIASFNMSIGPVMWVLFSEIFPTRVRGIAIPFFALIVSTVSYFVQQFFPWQLNNMGATEIFLFYAVCITVCLALLFYLLPETKNKSIEEIEASLVRA
ncbi:MFS transporter, sugar porter (SP) family [Microbulbifer thermotolerans]|uniref:MFS transporter n=1 Tax=Microbulbifer thermotolerans TaxID=252514 RepID=UPI0008E74004|nr:MFS transporter [Microbulbifer thermotolerans]SFC76373.1 MFS transporter, sugar porter (SP) family [Microbulbifer thermotolerans]